MSPNPLAAFAYLVSGILFILALRGLSSPATSQAGNRNGMIGMAMAMRRRLPLSGPVGRRDLGADSRAMAIGGDDRRCDRPQHRDDRHAATRCRFPQSCRPRRRARRRRRALCPPKFWHRRVLAASTRRLIELALGVAIGALTFTGSVIAFAKLDGNMRGADHPADGVMSTSPAGPVTRAADRTDCRVGRLALGVLADRAGGPGLRRLIIVPIGGADMPVVISMLNSYSGWAAAGIGFTLGNFALIITGALVGSSGAILAYIMCKGMNRNFISVIMRRLRRRDCRGGRRRSRADGPSSRARPMTPPSS